MSVKQDKVVIQYHVTIKVGDDRDSAANPGLTKSDIVTTEQGICSVIVTTGRVARNNKDNIVENTC